MAQNYVLFYSLENAMRDLIHDVLSDSAGEGWWDTAGIVPDRVRENATNNRTKEEGTGVTLRSDRMLDYTNFGELGEIIKVNWEHFQAIFIDKRAVERIIANLNTLRASIAHCTALSEDEETRLHLSLRDWFRQQA
ncbi:Swt1 family HEPN domain-containing protein [Jannaschia ovalis]|uniref:Swt1 family HEPN domain-containing protein n=1 Tax=Jannaschia ovalis TaxID=3038773 RepID=A0ABY8L930_9RHOB|nr:Swt1 family HEPN domain-containing protein [Jannaschia sp. GRR-S6-38]WGH77861.1 Swt1 family HEPN domain-containing protein [Jannaschia sp. GRR-S6-38]